MNTAELRRVVGPWADLVSDRSGIIRGVTLVERGAEEPSPPIICQAELSHFDFRKAELMDRAAAGKGATKEQAIRGAIGEAVERYCAAQIDPALPILSSAIKLGAQAVAPPEFVLFSGSQYKSGKVSFHQWTPSDELAWVPGRELPSGAICFVPACLTYLKFPSARREDSLAPPSSNGLAAGPDIDFAVLHALYELIERDAFLITWMTRLPAPEIQFAHASSLATSIHDHYLRHGVKLRVFRMCTDLSAHVMLAVALDQTGTGPAAIVGLGCEASPYRALIKALFEICQAHSGERHRYSTDPPGSRLRHPEDVHTLVDHSGWFTIREHLDGLSFLLESGRSEELSSLPDYSASSVRDSLENCVASLVRSGSRVLYVDLTTPDVVDYGFRVVRGFATGLQPIHFGWGQERLGGSRLFEMPKKLGFANRTLSESDLNPHPHPLA
jgi:ribosomal protein S12 methylthiotransferase accessory factor